MTVRIITLIKRIYFAFLYLLAIIPNAFAEGNEVANMCPTLAEYEAEGGNFFLKSSYDILADTMSNIATGSWGAFAGSLQGVITIGIGIYIAVYTLKNVGSFSQQDVAAYLSGGKGVIPIAVKGAAIIFLLGNQSFVYSKIVSPVVSAGFDVAGIVLGGTGIGGSFSSSGSVRSLFSLVINQSKIFYQSAYGIVAMGRELICLWQMPESMADYYWILLPFGFIFFVYGWMLIIGLSFYLLDVLFRLGVACVLLPLAIACAMSKLTSYYTKKTWDLFINVTFNFIMLGLVMKFSKSMLTKAASSSKVNLYTELSKNMDKAQIETLVDNFTATGLLLTCVCCVLSFKLFMEVESITDKVSSTTSVGKLGQKMGAAVTKPLVNATQSIAKQPFKIAGAAASEIAISGAEKVGLPKLAQKLDLRLLSEKLRRARTSG